MTITFQKESFVGIMKELPAIIFPHWKEVALDQEEIPLDPDWDSYIQFEMMGALHVMTAREDGKLVGYYIGIVKPHLHYKSSKTAFSDSFYIYPECRSGWTGYKLFQEADKMLKELGVQKSYVVTKVHLPITIIMKRLRYRLTEWVYTKLL